jgi:hypothetical protein
MRVSCHDAPPLQSPRNYISSRTRIDDQIQTYADFEGFRGKAAPRPPPGFAFQSSDPVGLDKPPSHDKIGIKFENVFISKTARGSPAPFYPLHLAAD